MNPQLLQMLLPYLLQLFGQGQSQDAQSPLPSLFGQNGSNTLMQPTAPSAPTNALLNPQASGVGGQTPVTGQSVGPQIVQDPGQANSVPSPQNQISPTGAPQSLSGIWNSLLAGLQNNSLSTPAAPAAPAGNNSFLGG